ncbi:spherical body protein, putative [Babesia ovis]|uniref:Spherical body protein, putative n=1 Tax=Babesia ovis TaxID=5869 RepID=A0A9W5TBH7_BABOV|nr:spherical body protein, putative [Babesia ovis]
MDCTSQPKLGSMYTLCMALLSILNKTALNLNDQIFPDSVGVAYGTFGKDGQYRMLQTTTETATRVMDGYKLLVDMKPKNKEVSDVYVEEFKLYRTKYICVTFDGPSVENGFHRVYIQKRGNEVLYRTREQKMAFVKGPVRLVVDINPGYLHPVIDTEEKSFEHSTSQWYYIGNKIQNDSNQSKSRLWADEGDFIMSPIRTIDSVTARLDGEPTLMIGHITRFVQSRDEGSIMIHVPGRSMNEHLFYIPTVNRGIFEPKCMIPVIWTSDSDRTRRPINRPYKVVIDVSGKSFPSRHVAILANYIRGSWLYTQHAILSRRDMTDLNIKVKDDTLKLTIYNVRPDQFVTHVEVFKHIDNDDTYVYVHAQKISLSILPEVSIYKLQELDNRPAYVELDEIGKRAAERIFTNIECDLCKVYYNRYR